jgi:mannose-6-phosphate isomerase-like protein (cupin superfamily)
MSYSPIRLRDKLAKFSEQWSPRVIAELNDYQFKLVKLQGDFVWHSHPETDEAFLIVDGELDIHFRDGEVRLAPGDLYIVPKGIEHKPFAAQECSVLLIEPRGTLNTGDAGGELTAEQNIWI